MDVDEEIDADEDAMLAAAIAASLEETPAGTHISNDHEYFDGADPGFIDDVSDDMYSKQHPDPPLSQQLQLFSNFSSYMPSSSSLARLTGFAPAAFSAPQPPVESDYDNRPPMRTRQAKVPRDRKRPLSYPDIQRAEHRLLVNERHLRRLEDEADEAHKQREAREIREAAIRADREIREQQDREYEAGLEQDRIRAAAEADKRRLELELQEQSARLLSAALDIADRWPLNTHNRSSPEHADCKYNLLLVQPDRKRINLCPARADTPLVALCAWCLKSSADGIGALRIRWMTQQQPGGAYQAREISITDTIGAYRGSTVLAETLESVIPNQSTVTISKSE
jgi:hypothetical protein